MANEIADMRDMFFITYNGVIKNPAVRIMRTMASDKYYDLFRDFIDVERISVLSDLELLSYVIQSPTRNPFYHFMVADFNWQKSLSDMMDVKRDPLLFHQSEPLVFYNILINLAKVPTTSGIVVWTPIPDERIARDLKVIDDGYGKIEYISGGFIDAIKAMTEKPTSYILNDVDWIPILIENDLIQFKDILLANYAYQYKDNPEDPSRARVLDVDGDITALENQYKFRTRMFEISSAYRLVDSNLFNNIRLMNMKYEGEPTDDE